MSNKITVIIFAVLMLGLSAFAVLKPHTEYSESERRKLAAFPKFTLSSFESGSFAKNFETASLDQFPLRDKFRTVKALAQYKLFGFSDKRLCRKAALSSERGLREKRRREDKLHM